MKYSLQIIFLFNLILLSENVAFTGEEKPKTETKPEVKDTLRLVLPSVIYAVPGIETNLYFDNVSLVINPANYVFDVHCKRGHLQNERWTWIPKDSDIGDYAFQLNVLNQNNQIIASQKSILRVAPKDAGKDKTINLLMIGDSLTHGSVYARQVLALSKKFQSPQLKFIGSHNPKNDPEVRHEGYGGWTAVRFATHFKKTARTGYYRERGSPFLYAEENGKPKLDFPRYCKEFNEGKAPDVVTIFLGPNDVYSATDETIAARTDTMIKHLDILVKMIHDYNGETKIGLMLPVPPASSQDAFGTTIGRGQTRWQYKRNQHYVVEQMEEYFQKSKSKHISIVPTHINLDCQHNYPAKSVPWNAHNTEKTVRQYNAVHPAVNGYLQIGDSVYCWLKSMSK